MRRSVLRLAIGFWLLVGGLAAQTTIAEFTAGTAVSITGVYFGQLFTTPTGGQRMLTSFNFFADAPPTTPIAVGKLYVFTAPYTGTPAGLTTGLPNLIGVSSSVSGGKYIFSPPVTLNPNTTYHVYTDSTFVLSGTDLSGLGYYASFGATSNFSSFGGSLNFRATEGPLVSTVPIGKPALVSLSLLLAGCASLLMRRRQSWAD